LVKGKTEPVLAAALLVLVLVLIASVAGGRAAPLAAGVEQVVLVNQVLAVMLVERIQPHVVDQVKGLLQAGTAIEIGKEQAPIAPKETERDHVVVRIRDQLLAAMV
jgi:hypothetical protein